MYRSTVLAVNVFIHSCSGTCNENIPPGSYPLVTIVVPLYICICVTRSLVPVNVIVDHDVESFDVLNVGVEGSGQEGLLAPVCQAPPSINLLFRKASNPVLIDGIFRQLRPRFSHHPGLREEIPVIDSGSLFKIFDCRLSVVKLDTPSKLMFDILLSFR